MSADADFMLTPLRMHSSDARQTAGQPTGMAQTENAFSSTFSDSPLARVLAAQNPLLEAARPLLRILAELPSLTESTGLHAAETPDFHDSETLREFLIHDIQQFQYVCDRAHLRREHVVTVRYCVCTALDEAISRLPHSSASSSASSWGNNSLLILFHNEASGGEKFFLLLGRMAQDPVEHLAALEVLYHILSLNFQGRYALMPDGQRQLEMIHSRLLGLLLDHRTPVQPALSPHREGSSTGRFQIVRALPVWVSASVLGAGLLGLYFMLSAELIPHEQALSARLEKLGSQPVALPFSPTGLPLERWFSREEQQRFGLRVEADAQRIILPGAAFVSGANIRESLYPALDILAKQLKASPWQAEIIGHTDNVALREGSVFRDNSHLSEERAKAVLKALIARGLAAECFSIAGKGDSEPLASNNTEAGRQSNRRVEIRLREAGTLPLQTDSPRPESKNRDVQTLRRGQS